jgi:excisionase family DNA binding protein
MPIQREYLSPNEIAEYLGVSPFTIRRYIKLGELRAVKLLGGFRVHKNDLQAFLKAHEVNPEEEMLEPEENLVEQVHASAPLLPPRTPAPRPSSTVPEIPMPQSPPRRPRGRPRKNPLPM